VCRVPRHHAAILPHHKHPHRGLGGWWGQALPLASFRRWDVVVRDLHHRHLIAADRGMRRQIDGAVTAMVITAVVAVATCCGSVAAATLRGASLVAAAVLPVTRGALDERRLMGTNASDLSALADARGGGAVGATLRTQK
jgi:hypothetical protein